MAENLLQKTAKTARNAMPRTTPPRLYAPCEWVRTLGQISARFISPNKNTKVQEGAFSPANRSTASGSSSMASASLNLLKKPQSVMRKVSSTSCASLKYWCSRANRAPGMRFGLSQAAIAYSTTSLSLSSNSGWLR
jgi:hypothetical protein